jgi:hypothetical protein
MKVRHATALALAGWYLMMPPANQLGAPLSQWKTLESFDSASQCRDWLMDFQRRATSDQKQIAGKVAGRMLTDAETIDLAFADSWKAGMDEAQCVATDDPRLKP